MAIAGAQPVTISKYAAFAVTYLPHWMRVPCARDHHRMFDVLSDRDKKRVYFEASRGKAKTTWCSSGFGLFNVCESDDEAIQIGSRSSGKTGTATKIMRAVKRELETNKLLIHDYGLRRGSEWGQECIEVIRGDGHRVMLYSLGKHSSIRGSRGTVIIDDPQNSADCRSETVLAADEDWFFEDVLPVMTSDQRLIFVATPISPISLASTVKRLPSFESFSFPAEQPVGSGISSWPEWQSDEYLAMQRADMGIERYNAEYNCMPKVPGNPIFKAEWFKTYDHESIAFERIKRDIIYIVTGVDTAESKASAADETWLITIGATDGANPDYYVLDARHNHWTSREGAAQVLQVFDTFCQHKTVAESRVKPKTNQAGDAFIEDVKALEHLQGKYVNIYPIRPESDKVTRARYVQGICQQGRVYYDPNSKGQQAMMNQLTMFTGDQQFHDDAVDAFVYSLTDHKDCHAGKDVSDGPQIILPGKGRRRVSGMV